MAFLNIKKALSRLTSLKEDLPTGGWIYPDLAVLDDIDLGHVGYEEPIDKYQVMDVLSSYGLDVTFEDSYIGHSVATYIYRVPMGTKLGSIHKYQGDMARDLGVSSLRIVPVEGYRSCIGIEVECLDKMTVSFKELAIDTLRDRFSIPLGVDSFGGTHSFDIRKQPHMLVAGQTGSGKSVFLNTIIASLILKNMPYELKLLLVDPKQVEFAQFETLPHLLEPIAVDTESAFNVVDVAVEEMEERFSRLKALRVRNIESYNSKVSDRDKLPYIVLIVDEFADLMMMGTPSERKAVEGKIVRIAQKARAVGIHLILATQKPLQKVVTSLIKANMPAQVAFKVQKSIDSKVILDEVGAEELAGKGDLLFTGVLDSGRNAQLQRAQAPYISEDDLEKIINGGLNAK